jgi:hypothetical protein
MSEAGIGHRHHALPKIKSVEISLHSRHYSSVGRFSDQWILALRPAFARDGAFGGSLFSVFLRMSAQVMP